ncbi:hypothetical protein DFH11DRAFT_1505667, partial [Phellopilus nigrolimitatus]
VLHVFPVRGESQVAHTIRIGRKGEGLIDLYGMILHVPELAEGYNKFFTNVVGMSNSLPKYVRVLIVSEQSQ